MIAAVLLRWIDHGWDENLRRCGAGGLRPADLAEGRGHDPDHLIALVVERDGAPDDAPIGAKSGSPQRFAQHHDSWTPPVLIVWPQRPANDWRDAQDVKQ